MTNKIQLNSMEEVQKTFENWYDNPVSQNVMKNKYLHENEKDHNDLINRIVNTIKEQELSSGYYKNLNDLENDFLKPLKRLLTDGSFFPGGRSLYALGSKGKFYATTSNCYVMKGPEDSIQSIFETVGKCAKVLASGGGLGLRIDKLRPEGAKTNNSARTSTGAVSFIDVFNTVGHVIGYHGRRGAMLIGMRMSHPDIESFIELRKHNKLESMNISCVIDDKFMKALKENNKYTLYFDVESTGEKIRKEINPRILFNKFCEMNWDYGDPGVLFIDKIRNYNLQQFNPEFKINCCNPCAEYTGPDYNSCNLGSFNLYNYVQRKFTKNAYFDYNAFRKDIHIAVRTLDDILDYGYETQPLDENREIIKKWRSIGLGYFGLADAFIALGIKYGEPDSIKFAKNVTKNLLKTAIEASALLAKERGTFEKCDKKAIINSNIFTLVSDPKLTELVKKYGMRNAQLISIAPTGSLSALSNCTSSGIEPIYKVFLERSSHSLEEQKASFFVTDRAVMELLAYHNISPNTSIEEIKQRFPHIVEALDINGMKRLDLQAAIQPFSDNAISSTINVPENTSVGEIYNLYIRAHELDLKGITVFRENCSRISILNTNSNRITKNQAYENILNELNKVNEEEPSNHKTTYYLQNIYNNLNKISNGEFSKIYSSCQCDCCESETEKSINNNVELDTLLPIKRSSITNSLSGRTYKKSTACVSALYVTINHDENNNMFEVFTNKSEHGCSANIKTITRLVSAGLRSGIKVEKIIEELKENACQACQTMIRSGKKDLSLSCPIAIAESMEEEYKILLKEKQNNLDKELHDNDDLEIYETNQQEEKHENIQDTKNVTKEEYSDEKNNNNSNSTNLLKCPRCGNATVIPEGIACASCKICGWSKC